jgi:hypothetical protein
MSRDIEEDELRDALNDAFMAYWRGADTDRANLLWLAYCKAQTCYDDYLVENVVYASGKLMQADKLVLI